MMVVYKGLNRLGVVDSDVPGVGVGSVSCWVSESCMTQHTSLDSQGWGACWSM